MRTDADQIVKGRVFDAQVASQFEPIQPSRARTDAATEDHGAPARRIVGPGRSATPNIG